jgi:hypothetical protein
MFRCQIPWTIRSSDLELVADGRTKRFNIRSAGMWTRLKTLELKEIYAKRKSFGTFALLLLDFQLPNTFFFNVSCNWIDLRAVARLFSVEVTA